MRKIYLTEEQFKKFIEFQLKESIIPEKSGGAFAKNKLDNVIAHLRDKANSGDENFLNTAKQNGLNIDYLKGTLSGEDYKKEFNSEVKALLREKNSLITGWVKEYLPILRKCFPGGGMKFDKGEESVTRLPGIASRALNRGTDGKPIISKEKGIFDELNPEDKKEVLLLKDFLDKEGLTFLYRRCNKPESIKTRYGLDVDSIDCNTPVNKINIDFSNLSDSDIKTYYDGTRVAWINARLKELGYDVESDEDGNPVKITDDNVAWKGTDGKEGLVDIAKAGKLEQVAKRYVERKYGMDFTFGKKGDSVFSFGNQKISDDTLIINFTSALRCPAWNECLLKDVCYARTTEKNYDNALNRNLRTNFIWEQTKEDKQLMSLMLELIRAYIFNYRAAVSALNKTSWKNKFTQESLSKMTMREIQSTYGQEVLDILSKTKRASVVRLNEDGDFIGQWLVDAWDEWAGDFKLAGVKVAAYTCRALNYETVKNLVLNLSQERLVAGQNAPAVERYFYAVEPEEYDALKDTYAGSQDFSLDVNADKITPIYRTLIENGEAFGYYYKCPCGRGKMVYKEIDKSQLKKNDIPEPCTLGEFLGARIGSKKVVSFNGKLYKLVKNTNASTKVDCYKCRICYGLSNGNIKTENGEAPKPELPKYVLVSAHGANRDNYSAERKLAGKQTKEWIAIQNGENVRHKVNEEATVEANNQNSPLAIKQITKNAVNSVVDMMREKGSPQAELNEVRKTLNSILQKL